jgi:hypothetical protein
VRDGENGLLVPYNNPAALAWAALLLLGQPHLRARLVAGGQHTLATRYCETELVDRIEALYATALCGRQ